MKLACQIAYDGANYSGWQTQPHASSVQEELTRAIAKVANHPIDLTCAGRTDAGVHATHQIIHFESEADRTLDQWRMGVNSNLPEDICLQWVKTMPEDFHARFSATERHYCYLIINQKVKPCFLRKNITWHASVLNLEAMHEAGQSLIGEHDFTSFRASACQSKSKHRCVSELSVRQQGAFIAIEIKANAFLHHMVRNIVGSLLEIGEGRQPISSMGDLLLVKDRTKAAPTAPPDGLYLIGVKYPDNFGLTSQSTYPCFF
ncbi:MAG: tRNA pseudouridine(38-40) synthase TruA [Gammaproteobacteria bacterium]